MPLRDETGKRLSGAEQLAHANAPLPEVGADAAAAFERIGPPPESPDEMLDWARRLLATATWLALTGKLDAQRARLAKDNAAAIGMTHNRARVEKRTSDLEEKLAKRRAPSGAVKTAPAATIARPATARLVSENPDDDVEE
jgi:hypothetical protein